MEARADFENLLLLCRNCHKPVDDGGQRGLFTVEVLTEKKRAFEQRIAELTALAVAPQAVVLRMVGTIRGSQPELTTRTVQLATVHSGYFPTTLEGRVGRDVEIDLREMEERMTPELFSEHATRINRHVNKINDAVRKDQVERLAVFAFARIPLLIHLGAQLSDKAEMLVFDRHRSAPEEERWIWPISAEPPQFEFTRLLTGTENLVTLIVNLSGSVDPMELPQEIVRRHHVYVLRPDRGITPAQGLIGSREALQAFERKLSEAFAHLEAQHAGLRHLNVAGAIPLSAGVSIGRHFKRNVTPALRIFDRDEDTGTFVMALEVRP